MLAVTRMSACSRVPGVMSDHRLHLGRVPLIFRPDNANGQRIASRLLRFQEDPCKFLCRSVSECFLPETTAITYKLLCERNDPNLYSRSVIPGYGHIDSVGQTLIRVVFAWPRSDWCLWVLQRDERRLVKPGGFADY
jgi:hypothetical protein